MNGCISISSSILGEYRKPSGEFHIGGYQVLHKWLKDRRGRKLAYDDLKHYQQMVAALSETNRIMSAIDAAIPQFPIE